MSDVSPRLPDAEGFKGALFIASAVSCLLIGLVVLRFICNIAIDVCILGDIAAARRSIRECWSFAFGPFSRATRDEEVDQSIHAAGGDDDANLDTLIRRLSPQEKSLLLDSILTSKVRACYSIRWLHDTNINRSASLENVSFISCLSHVPNRFHLLRL